MTMTDYIQMDRDLQSATEDLALAASAVADLLVSKREIPNNIVDAYVYARLQYESARRDCFNCVTLDGEMSSFTE